MSANSKIEWTDHTFNPWIGCTKVSPGCDHCYAEGTAARFKLAQWGSGMPRRLSSEDYWKQPITWDRKAERDGVRPRVFCASMADIFDNEAPGEWRARLWELIKATPNLDWLLLTKRIGNAATMLPESWSEGFPNVWLGATIVNQEEADRDIPKLLATPARVRFLSMEPLLGPVKIPGLQCEGCGYTRADKQFQLDHYLCKNPTATIDWIIVGGESGRDARPMHPDWARCLRDQCHAAGVPFFFKQWGEWQPISTVEERRAVAFEKLILPLDSSEFDFVKSGKKIAGRLLDGREWNEFPGKNL